MALLIKHLTEHVVENAWLRGGERDWRDLFVEYVEGHLHEPISLTQLARAVHRSPSSLTDHVRKAFAVSPYQYVLQRKLARARERLESGRRVGEVAREFAFYDAFHFSKAFRKHFGTAPSKVRPGRGSVAS